MHGKYRENTTGAARPHPRNPVHAQILGLDHIEPISARSCPSARTVDGSVFRFTILSLGVHTLGVHQGIAELWPRSDRRPRRVTRLVAEF